MIKRGISLLLVLLLLTPAGRARAEVPRKQKKGTAPAAAPAPAPDAPKKGLSLGKVAESQKDPAREKLDEALRAARKEDYAASALALYDIVESDSPLKDEATYNLAKDLYRLGLFHSALTYFSDLLAKGSGSRYYGASLEWCLFISRKIVGDERVHESVAKYAPAEFPKEYKDEFNFHLAKFHYARALAMESAKTAGATGETRVKETSTGGKSFKGDIFGGDEPGASDAEGDAAKAGGDKTKKKNGVSINEDIFGFEEAPKAKTEKAKPEKVEKADEPKKKSGRRGKSRRGREEPKKEEPKKEEPKKEEPPKEKEQAKEETPPPKKKAKSADGDGLTPKEHIEAAGKNVAQVSSESRFGPRAKFLEGLVYYKQGRENDALEAFKAVVRLTKPGQPYADERLRELAFFQLARTHFGAKQPSYSIFYYDKVDRDSFGWLDAIYEASWAEFRLGNFEKALGNLLTLHSPFFKDEYYPESHILKAVIYYENCRYPEAKSILTEFLRRYEPVEEELKKLTDRDQAPAQYYEVLENLRANDVANDKSRASILGQIMAIALQDRELRRLDLSHREVVNEMKSFAGKGAGFGQSRLASHLEAVLTKAKGDLAKEAGRAVKRTLERERDAIKLLVQQSVRIDIETSRAEQERIEQTLQGIQSSPADRDKEFVEWTNDEREVWPFSGEYWRDELGTYQLTLAHSCQASRIAQQ